MTPAAADRFLEVQGFPRLRYRDAGHGPAILLVHGWLLDLTMWDSLAAALVPSSRVIRWDRRGFGQSEGTPDLAADAADAVRLLEALHVDRVAVLGMSQGCRIALSIVEQAPRKASGLILDGAPPMDGLPNRGWHDETPALHYRSLLVDQGIEALRDELASHPLLQLHANDVADQSKMDAMLARYDGADLMALPAAPPAFSANPAANERFERLQLPVLILNGELDSLQRLRVGETLAASIAGAERHTVPGSRHIACWDNPAAYNALVRDFLAKTS